MVQFNVADEIESKLKRKVQIFVITAVSLFFVLVVVVVFQFAVRINQEATKKSLANQNEALAEAIERAEADTEYFKSPEFKYDYALRYLNKGKPGDKVYV